MIVADLTENDELGKHGLYFLVFGGAYVRAPRSHTAYV
jgi:hypothetical protein